MVGDEGAYPAKMRASPRAIWPWAVDEKLWAWEMPQMARPGVGGRRLGKGCAAVELHARAADAESAADQPYTAPHDVLSMMCYSEYYSK